MITIGLIIYAIAFSLLAYMSFKLWKDIDNLNN